MILLCFIVGFLGAIFGGFIRVTYISKNEFFESPEMDSTPAQSARRVWQIKSTVCPENRNTCPENREDCSLNLNKPTFPENRS